GTIATWWNAEATSATLTVTFPYGVSLAGLDVYTVAGPASSETYTVSLLDNAQWISGGTTTVAVGTSPGQVFIPLPAGTYDAVHIAVASSASWVQIYEITTVPPS
ncbi:MAG: hypothetical protein ACP5QO_15870, partial [Clostridia bacterium]